MKFLFILDGDHRGDVARKKYSAEFGIPENRIATRGELVPGATFIEDLLDQDALDFIQSELNLTKHPAQIRRFFQERLASDNVKQLSAGFAARAAKIMSALKNRLEQEA